MEGQRLTLTQWQYARVMAPRSQLSLLIVMCPQLPAQFPFLFSKLRLTIFLGDLAFGLLFLLQML